MREHPIVRIVPLKHVDYLFVREKHPVFIKRFFSMYKTTQILIRLQEEVVLHRPDQNSLFFT